MLKFELRKIIKSPLFICAVVGTVLLSVFIFYRQYTEVYTITILEGTEFEKTYKLSGSERIEYDKTISARFENRTIDDNFLLDVDLYYVELAVNHDPRINASSLLSYYRTLTPAVKQSGVIAKSTGEIFKGELPVYWHTINWEVIIYAVAYMFTVIVFACIITASRVFCIEYESDCCAVTMPTMYGRSKTPLYKIIATFITVTAVYFFINILTVCVFGAFYGFENATADIRVLPSGTYVGMNTSMTCIELFILQILICYVGLLIITSLTLFISSISKNTFAALIISGVVTFLPNILQLNKIENRVAKSIHLLSPSNMNGILLGDWTSYNIVPNVFFYVAIIAVISVPLFCLLSYQIYRRHRIA